MTKNNLAIKKHTIISEFKALTKFGLSLSVVVSSIAGYLLAAQKVDYYILLLLAIGGYCMVGASNIYNQVIEIDLDKLMERTKNRPLPTNRVSTRTALILAVVLTLIGLVTLYSINPKTAMFSAISIFLYTSAYTPLKTKSPISVFVGAIPGAIPFMLGWVAATNQFGMEAGILFMIQFFWQFPHFWSIGWLQYDEYKKAGFNMMPLGDKNKKAVIFIIFYTIVMIIASILPAFNFTGDIKLSIVSAILVSFAGIVMLYYAVQLYKTETQISARKLMLSSVFYITFIQFIFVIDKFLS